MDGCLFCDFRHTVWSLSILGGQFNTRTRSMDVAKPDSIAADMGYLSGFLTVVNTGHYWMENSYQGQKKSDNSSANRLDGCRVDPFNHTVQPATPILFRPVHPVDLSRNAGNPCSSRHAATFNKEAFDCLYHAGFAHTHSPGNHGRGSTSDAQSYVLFPRG